MIKIFRVRIVTLLSIIGKRKAGHKSDLLKMASIIYSPFHCEKQIYSPIFNLLLSVKVRLTPQPQKKSPLTSETPTLAYFALGGLGAGGETSESGKAQTPFAI